MLGSGRLRGLSASLAMAVAGLGAVAVAGTSHLSDSLNVRRFFPVTTRSRFDDSPHPDTRYRKHKPVSGFAAVKRAAKKSRNIKRNRLAHR